jgi:hypothetical protein
MPELVDEIRVPLHELQADVDYLIGRVIADPTCAPTITASIKGKLAAIEAAALILNEPQPMSTREAALEAAARAFIEKVDRGHARSLKSYSAFLAALSLPRPQPRGGEA